MAKTHIRTIGNMDPNAQAGVDPRAGVSGNSKTRRHYPAGQEKKWCGWRYPDKSKGRPGCARKSTTCEKCFTFGGKMPSEYKPRKKGNGKDGSALAGILLAVLIIVMCIMYGMSLKMRDARKKIDTQSELLQAMTAPVPEASTPASPAPKITTWWDSEVDKSQRVPELGYRSDGTVIWRSVAPAPPEPEPEPEPEKKRGLFSWKKRK